MTIHGFEDFIARHPMPDTGGVVPGLPSELYHRREIGVVSKSALDRVARSPAHYKAWVDGTLPDEDTPAMRFGRAFHCAILEPERFAEEYVTEPDFGDCRSSKNRAKRDEWRAANGARTAISDDDLETISAMRAAILAHPIAGKMIRDGQPELTVRWTDSETGLKCKCRADYYVKRLRMVADLKSCQDASEEAFRKDVAKYRYMVQDALYRAGFEAAGEPIQHFVFLAVEKAPPYAVAVYSLDAEGVGKGYSLARRDMATMAECLNKDEWPGYPPGIRTISLPPWAA